MRQDRRVAGNGTIESVSSEDHVLRRWRDGAARIVLLVLIVLGLPSWGPPLLSALRASTIAPTAWGYTLFYLAIILLAVIPRVEYRLRSWGLILAGYVGAVISLADTGLSGSGRLYLLLMPVLAAILIGQRAALATGALSLVAFTACALWLPGASTPSAIAWLEEGVALAAFLATTILLLNHFSGLATRSLQERQTVLAEWQRTSDALQEREERFGLVMQGTNDGIWDWNLLTNEVYYSPRWKSMLGYAPEEIANHFNSWRTLVHPDDVDRSLAEIQRHLRGETPLYHLEHRLRHKDGSYRWILARGVSLRDAHGTPHRMAGSHTDITEARETEERIRRQNEYLTALHETALGVVSQLDVNELLEAVIDRAVSLVGAAYGWVFLANQQTDRLEIRVGTGLYRNYVGATYGHGEGLAGRIWDSGEPTAVADYQTWPGRSLLFEGEAIGAAMGVPLKSGAQVFGVIGLCRMPMEPSFSPDELDLMGSFAELASIALVNATLHSTIQAELSERNRAQAALAESEANLRSLLENAGNFAVYRILVDPSEPFMGRIILVSPSIKEILGITNPYDFGSWFEHIHPDDLTRVREANRQALENGQPFSQDLRFFHAGRQTWIWVHAASAPVFDPQGRAAYFNGLVLDVSEMKQAQEALESAYQKMELRVAERTRELTALNALSAVVSRSLDLKEILTSALDKTCEVVGMHVGIAYRLEAGGDSPSQPSRLRAMAHRGVSADLMALVDSLELEQTVVYGAARDGIPVVWQVAEYPHPEFRLPMEREGLRQAVSVPIPVAGRMVGTLVLGTDAPRDFAAEDLILLASIGQQVGVAMENARLFQAEREQHEEAEQRQLVAEALRHILASLNSTQSLQEILGQIVLQAHRVLGSDALSLFRLDRQAQVLRIEASQGLDAEYASRMIIPVGVGAVGQVVVTKQPVVYIPSTGNLAPVLNALSPDFRSTAEQMAVQYRTVVGVPLLLKDEVYGALALYYRGERAFTKEEMDLMVAFADQAALAIDNARLHEQAQQLAVSAERSRLARDLHDAVTQSLYSVTLYAEAAARLIDGGRNREAVDHLHELRDTAQEALREMRLLIFQLRPPMLEKLGLAAALQARLEAVEIRGGVRAVLRVDGQEYADRVSFPVQEEIFHIAQEALNNVLRHARAPSVVVSICFQKNLAAIEVRDDGEGFDPIRAQRGGGLGLSGMKERAQKIAGQLTIDSSQGKGTRVRVEVPLEEPRPS